jgi:hypothetical protein
MLALGSARQQPQRSSPVVAAIRTQATLLQLCLDPVTLPPLLQPPAAASHSHLLLAYARLLTKAPDSTCSIMHIQQLRRTIVSGCQRQDRWRVTSLQQATPGQTPAWHWVLHRCGQDGSGRRHCLSQLRSSGALPCGTVRMQRECQGYREQQGGYIRTHHIMAWCSVRQHGRCGERFPHLQFVTLVRQARPATMARLGDSHFARAAVAWVAQFWTGVRALWPLSPADKVAGLTPGLRCCACWRHTSLLAGTKPSARCESSLQSQRLSWRGDARHLTCWHGFWATDGGERMARKGAGVDPVCKVAAAGQPPAAGKQS